MLGFSHGRALVSPAVLKGLLAIEGTAAGTSLVYTRETAPIIPPTIGVLAGQSNGSAGACVHLDPDDFLTYEIWLYNADDTANPSMVFTARSMENQIQISNEIINGEQQGLTPGATYTVKMRALNIDGYSALNDGILFSTPASTAPTGTVIIAIT